MVIIFFPTQGDHYILSQEGTTQGDPLAMSMYALCVVPLIQHLAGFDVTQIWYADDAPGSPRSAPLVG